MTGLTDTHTLLWAAEDPSLLGTQAKQLLFDPANTIYFSVVNTWEMAIKRAAGKMKMTGQLADIVRFAQGVGFLILPVALDHTLRVEGLPLYHHDPFDRLLVAQCMAENLTLISHDAKLPQYGIPILW